MPAEKLSPIDKVDGRFALRNAQRCDAKSISRLVNASDVLDTNSCYAYLLLCEHFAPTCLVAHSRTVSDKEAGLAGFVAAYRPPTRSNVIFVWQIAVAPWAQGQGLAKRLLHEVVGLPACRGVEYLEATITASNVASQRLFTSFASDLDADVELKEGFVAADFVGSSADLAQHEAERLYRIGPLPIQRLQPKRR